MEEIINTVLYLKDFFDNSFKTIYINISLLLFISLIIYYLLKKMNKALDERWDDYFVVVKKELIQMVAEFVIAFILYILIRDSFNINVIDLIKRNEIWKVIVGLWFIYHFKKGYSTFKYINYEIYLDKIEDGDIFRNPKLRFELMINQYQSNYDLELEKLGILKSLAPVSLIPLAAGFILENKEIVINLNTYTIIFFCILFMYIYKLWKCYDTLRFWRSRKRKVEERIMKLKEKCVISV